MAAVVYLHSRGLAHLDIKPGNIVVANDGRCKLTDFGCSRRIVGDGNNGEDLNSELFPMLMTWTSDVEKDDVPQHPAPCQAGKCL